MSNNGLKLAVLFLLMLLCNSCSMNGRLYTNKVISMTEDYNKTPVGSKTCSIENYRLREPVTRARLSLEWTTGKIARRAKENGINTIHYVDMHVVSWILGIYSKNTLIIYGD